MFVVVLLLMQRPVARRPSVNPRSARPGCGPAQGEGHAGTWALWVGLAQASHKATREMPVSGRVGNPCPGQLLPPCLQKHLTGAQGCAGQPCPYRPPGVPGNRPLPGSPEACAQEKRVVGGGQGAGPGQEVGRPKRGRRSGPDARTPAWCCVCACVCECGCAVSCERVRE